MSTLSPQPVDAPTAEESPHAVNVGPVGRLGRYTATHFRGARETYAA